MAGPYGSCEWNVSNDGWGGDLELDPVTGDLLLVQDTPGNPAATRQRITRMLLTNPRPVDLNSNAIGVPDDLQHPDYGAGLGAAVGENLGPRLTNGIKSRVLAALAKDPWIAATPAPSVTVTQQGSALYVSLQADTVMGDPLTINRLPINGG